MSSATYPLDYLRGSKDEPCLLVSFPTTQQAVKLFHHTMSTYLGSDVGDYTVFSLKDQGIGDEKVSGIFFQ